MRHHAGAARGVERMSRPQIRWIISTWAARTTMITGVRLLDELR